MRVLGKHILPANILLLVVGLADTLTTIHWVRSGQAVEFNPIMAAVLAMGIWFFVAVKLSTLGVYVIAIEWYRRRRSESLARAVGHVTAIAYIAIYAVSFCLVNRALILG